jgi:hypothetical protein
MSTEVVRIDLSQEGKPISSDLFGTFFEDLMVDEHYYASVASVRWNDTCLRLLLTTFV